MRSGLKIGLAGLCLVICVAADSKFAGSKTILMKATSFVASAGKEASTPNVYFDPEGVINAPNDELDHTLILSFEPSGNGKLLRRIARIFHNERIATSAETDEVSMGMLDKEIPKAFATTVEENTGNTFFYNVMPSADDKTLEVYNIRGDGSKLRIKIKGIENRIAEGTERPGFAVKSFFLDCAWK